MPAYHLTRTGGRESTWSHLLIAMYAPLAIAADQYDTASSPSQPSVCHIMDMTSRLDAATRALVATFRRQRPVGGGSLIITIFGDAIALRGSVVSLGSLIKLCQPFGITERLVRTSVARLAEADWLGAQRYGRRSEYHLSAGGLRRFADATRRIYSAGPDHWNGLWTLVLLPTSDTEAREALRKELAWLG